MASAHFYTYQLPPYTEGSIPLSLAFSVTFVAVATCFLSYAFLAHAISEHRDRLAGFIETRKQLWKVLAEKAVADRNNQIKSDFISVASHELRTPLYSITGYSDLLALTELTDEQRMFLESIKASCHALELITDNVLDFTKLENDNDESHAKPTKIDVKKLANDCVRQCFMKKELSKVDLYLVISESVPDYIYADEVYVSRVIMNLVGNAIKFTQDGYVLAELSANEERNLLVFTCSDSGIGIAIGSLEVIFKPFRQADSTYGSCSKRNS